MSADRTPARRSLSLSAGVVSYLEWPAPVDAPVLVFLHANGFHGGVYRRLLGPLAGEVRILAPDLRGHGRTTLPASPAELESWQVYVDDVEQVLDVLGAGHVWLAGHSLGGVAAALLAARSGDRVHGLVLVEPVFLPLWVLNLIRLLDLVGQGWRVGPAGPALRRRDGWDAPAAARAHYQGRGMFKGWPEGWLEDYLADGLVERSDGTVGLSCRPGWEARTFSSVPRDIWRRLREIRCPTTIIYGTDSDTFRPASASRAATVLPDLRMVPVEGATHFIPMERPEVVRDEIRRMVLRQVSKTPFQETPSPSSDHQQH